MVKWDWTQTTPPIFLASGQVRCEGGWREPGFHSLCFCRYYESFTNCTEMEANIVGCYWPNPLAQGFITGIHRQFFSNCTMDKVHLEDPPDEVLIPLIIIPVVLTVAMAGLVVWRSKRTDTLL